MTTTNANPNTANPAAAECGRAYTPPFGGTDGMPGAQQVSALLLDDSTANRNAAFAMLVVVIISLATTAPAAMINIEVANGAVTNAAVQGLLWQTSNTMYAAEMASLAAANWMQNSNTRWQQTHQLWPFFVVALLIIIGGLGIAVLIIKQKNIQAWAKRREQAKG